jgi:hypothetical protein
MSPNDRLWRRIPQPEGGHLGFGVPYGKFPTWGVSNAYPPLVGFLTSRLCRKHHPQTSAHSPRMDSSKSQPRRKHNRRAGGQDLRRLNQLRCANAGAFEMATYRPPITLRNRFQVCHSPFGNPASSIFDTARSCSLRQRNELYQTNRKAKQAGE